MPWGSVVELQDRFQPTAAEMLGRLRHELRHELFGVDVPARAEQQPVVADDPGVLQFEGAFVAEGSLGGVHVHVGHPAALRGTRASSRPAARRSQAADAEAAVVGCVVVVLHPLCRQRRNHRADAGRDAGQGE